MDMEGMCIVENGVDENQVINLKRPKQEGTFLYGIFDVTIHGLYSKVQIFQANLNSINNCNIRNVIQAIRNANSGKNC